MTDSTDSKPTPAYKKPEFWTTLLTSVAGLFLAFGAITPEQAKGIGEYVPNIIGALMSLLSTFKFVGTQHAAKVEVFRAMCAASMQRAEMQRAKPGATAQGVSDPKAEIARLAQAAGL